MRPEHVGARPARQVQAQGAGRQYPSPLRDWSSEPGAQALAEIVTERSREVGCPLDCWIVMAVSSHTEKGAARCVWGVRSRPIIPATLEDRLD
jgi:hypothetical protein